jgi:hypothetical protein
VAGHSARSVFDFVLLDPRVTIFSLTDKVIVETLKLNTIGEMHDRQIVGTVNLSTTDEETILITKDVNIVSSGLIQTVW